MRRSSSIREMHILPHRLSHFLPLVALLAAGCGNGEPIDAAPAAPAAARYPVRTDLMAVGNLGAPPRWYSAGYPPLRSLRLAPNTPDPEFVEKLRPLLTKDVLDPVAGLSDAQRDDIGRLLDQAFGTPAGPSVRIPTKDELAAMKADEMFSDGLPRGKTAKGVMEETRVAAEAAKAELGLDDDSLARGGVVYRRWCVQCHGATGGGDGANAVAAAAMPRDYRQGVFKFVTASPTSAVTRRGERGKPRKDDLKRTVRNGLDGSMMPPFPNIPDRDLDDLIGYVVHLSVRGETEFEVMAKAIKGDDDLPEGFTGKELEKLFASKLLTVLMNWHKAAESPVPVPPENCPTEADRIESAVRGSRAFLTAGCAGCHVNFGREPQLKYDLWGTVVQPRNLVLGVYRGGRRGEDLYARIYGGIYPSGMNEHKQLLAANPPAAGTPDFIWNIVHFLQALADPRLRQLVQLKDPAVKIEP
jgi:mono/diheme cytochrome c family protein